MNISETFIRRPVTTTLLTTAIALAGIAAFRLLPVSPLPQIDFPTIQVTANLPGASPETMASSVASPLERQFGRIAGLSEMTSTSALGTTNIALQFDLDRNIDAAARDVQAAINAAGGNLPANLPSLPTYKKVNPADSPIMILALTSNTVSRGKMYDDASSILAQKLSQVQGVGQVVVGGGALPAVRVDLNPFQLSRYGLGLEDIRSFLGSANAKRPKGQLSDATTVWSISTSDQLLKASEYQPLIVSYQNGAAVRLSDVARVTDSVQDVRNAGLADGTPAVMLIVFRQPGANIINAVDSVRAVIPSLEASISPAIKMSVVLDQTLTIRASLHDVEVTLLCSIALVIMVVFVFLRNARATMIPGVAVPISLIGTFAIMYLCGFSLDNLSLIALTISTGFVVDDAIVVVENISRYLEEGRPPVEAALMGAKGIGFTVMSISISLIAVFIPILLMGGIIGRLFREFAITMSAAIAVSLVVSLTATPMMCAKLLRPEPEGTHGGFHRAGQRVFDAMLRRYDSSLSSVLHHPRLALTVFMATLGLNIYLFIIVPKGFFPQQDNGRMMGAIQAGEDTSFQAMRGMLVQFVDIVRHDPAIEHVVAFTGGNAGATNSARMFIALKPYSDRNLTASQVIGRIRTKAARIAGATLYLQASQDLRVGAHSTNAQYQYTLQSEDLGQLNQWAPLMLKKMRAIRQLTDISSDQQNSGLEESLHIDRQTAARLGISTRLIDDTLYDAFGQREVSTMYTQLNQYFVVMEAAPQFWQDPETLKEIYLRSDTGAEVPLSAIAHYESSTTALTVNHQEQFPAVTISFNLAPGVALGDAVDIINAAAATIRMPASIHGGFQGTAEAFRASLANEPMLIAMALIAVYIVLGVLYESYVHPITILSTLPSAGVGALLALLICHNDLSVIALIGMILLIGIVKKNAILMIDFALEAEREEGKDSLEAIYQACLLRFRPIIMTTMAALLGGLPLALGTGTGSELRRPLGIAIVGGLAVSQMLTLYTTPIIYLYLDEFRLWCAHLVRGTRGSVLQRPAGSERR